MNLKALEDWFSERLGSPIFLEMARQVELGDWLSEAERRCCESMITVVRQREWLTGRAALKNVLRRLGLSLETSKYVFPHSRLSLSHSLEKAVAAGAHCASRGLGVDLEFCPAMAESAERFFLMRPEIKQMNRLTPARRARERVRLWSIKEAVFKADLKNAGCGLNHYRLCIDDAEWGLAEKIDGRKFVFGSRILGSGFISVAMNIEDNQYD